MTVRPARLNLWGMALFVAFAAAACSLVGPTKSPIDSSPAVTIRAPPTATMEGTPLMFMVSLSPPPSTRLHVSVTLTESGSMLDASPSGTVTIPAGATEATVTAATVDDSEYEPDSAVTIRVIAGAGHTVGQPDSATVTVFDNDDPRGDLRVRITAVSDSAIEGEHAVFILTSSWALPTDLTVMLTSTETGSMLAVPAQTTVKFGAQATEATATIVTVDDSEDELDSTVTVTVIDGPGYVPSTPNSATVIVADNDPEERETEAPIPSTQTIDGEQFCNRTPWVRLAILHMLKRSTTTCIDADPNAVPPVEATHETDITVGQLASITFLRFAEVPPINAAVLREFKRGDFEGLVQLRVLDLTETISSVRGGLAEMGIPLSVLGKIEELALVNNDLISFASIEFFRGLSNLRELDLRINNLVYELPGNPNRPENTAIFEIDPEIWKHLPELRKLWIGSNRILTLPPGFFRHLPMLEQLDMYDMWYEYHPYGFGSQALPAGVFAGLTRLRELDLGHNAIGATEVNDGLFDGLTALQELDLRENPDLRVLPRSVLSLPDGVQIKTDSHVVWPAEDEDR